jgi:hypothetical protein
VIGKVLRGRRVTGLIYYLYGPGRHEEHTDPHIVAGWRSPAELEPQLRPGGTRDFRPLTGLLHQPLAVLGERAPDRPVWHCVARAAPTDRMLSDREWQEVAADIMHRTDLACRGEEDDAVRWVAVRHADDHIHIVATLARQDGARPRVSNDYYRVREACLAAETRYSLRRTAPADRTAATRPTRAESEKATRQGRPEPARVTLQREISTAAAAAATEAEFFAALHQAGILVRQRHSTRNPAEITGYAVALPASTTSTGAPVWYSGGKLAADLTLPKLRRRWANVPEAESRAPGSLTPQERAAIWDHVGQTCTNAAHQIQTATTPAEAADAAWAAADVLHIAASVLGDRTVRTAACAYSRAARHPYGRIPRPTSAGRDLRRAARLRSATARTAHDRDRARAALIVRLAALASAVSDLRHAQHHAAQAAAARHAAQHLLAAHRQRRDAHLQGRARQPTAATITRTTFPRTADQATHLRPNSTTRPAAQRASPSTNPAPSTQR